MTNPLKNKYIQIALSIFYSKFIKNLFIGLFIFCKFFCIYFVYNIDLNWLRFLPIIVPLILSIAFFTVFERKILAAMQRRRGPNITGIFGILQAFADGFKLVGKETIIPSSSNYIIFLAAPILTFAFSIFSWVVIPFDFNIVIVDTNLGLLFLFAVSSLNIYGIVMSGWSSNSKYAFLGAFRSTAQLISYEVSLGLIIMPVLLFSGTANLSGIILAQETLPFFIPLWPSTILFFISILAETNRLPFDLPEAESELVSGFNVEYSSLTFALFFLAEYCSMILMCSLIVILFFGGWLPILNILPFNMLPNWFWFSFKVVFFMFLFVWVRGSLPRYRYDQLMTLGWKVILPLSFSLLIYSIGLIIFFY